MVRSTVKRELKLAPIPDSHEIINDDGSMFQNAKPAWHPINGLNTIAGDLDFEEATARALMLEREELEAKLAELEALIRQTRFEIGAKSDS